MKVGIVVPYSWSFWGAVVEHAESQAEALRGLGVETRLIMGNDPPGSFTRVLHPRLGRHGSPPPEVIPVGRSVIVPANGSLPNIVLSPRSVYRIRRALEREKFDLLHLHEPMTPAVCVAALALARTPIVATFHAAGSKLAWAKAGMRFWGFLLDRIDERIAVSEQARAAAISYAPGEYHVVPNGILIPAHADPAGREHHVAFVGRHEPRKGLQVVLRAWPRLREETGARLRVIGSDPLAVRLLLSRLRVPEDGIDVLGFLPQEQLTEELLAAKVLVAPSLGGESFGMVLTRALACATPVIASDIDGYREVMTPEVGVTVPPDEPRALGDAVVSLLEDEPRRRELGRAARALAQERYSWDEISRRLVGIYRLALGGAREPATVVG
jgi:phosphatidyl-myo-inositol alpha-mannosyltransferase